MKCDICEGKTEGKFVIRDSIIEKKDGSDFIVCGDCLNLFANKEFDKLIKKIKIEKWKCRKCGWEWEIKDDKLICLE